MVSVIKWFQNLLTTQCLSSYSEKSGRNISTHLSLIVVSSSQCREMLFDRSYLRPSPPGVVFLCHSSQAFLCSPPQLCKWRSLAPWTECKSYSVISLSLRATDQRKQKLYWLASPDENQPVALKFPSVFKIPYLALLANQQAHKSMEAYLQSWLFKEIYAHHSPGSDSCASERRE